MANGEQSYGELCMKGLIIEVLSGMNTSCKGKYDPNNIVYAEISMNGDDTTFILGLIKCEGKNSKGKDFKCNCVPTYPTEKDMNNN